MPSSVTLSADTPADDQDASSDYWRRSIEDELASIQEDVLTLAILVLPVLGLVWLIMALPDILIPQTAASRPMLVLLVGAVSAHYLRRRSRVVASWFIVGAMILAVCNMIAARTSPMAITAGILIVVAANALLRPQGSLAATVIAAAALKGVRHLAFPDLPWWVGLDVLLLYLLIWGAVYAGSLQVRRAFEISTAGWATSRTLLRELRARRAELHRVVTAQRESAYRLERMNRELLEARREAEQARRTKEQLVATVSHELRGPLNLILGFSRILALSPEVYGDPLPAAYRRDIDVVYRNSEHLSSLIDDVLDLSRAEADSLPLVKDSVHLAEDVVARVTDAVEPLITRKGLDMRLDVDPDLPAIVGDAVRLRQILTNLVSNAARLTDQGHIAIRAAQDGGHLLVSVSDTGPGIPGEQMSRLFTPFTTLRPDDQPGGGGAGLGLSISKRLVELHGGEMWAESVEGKGTCFSFTLPLPNTGSRPASLLHLRELAPRAEHQRTCVVVGKDPQLLRTLARHMHDLDVVGVPPDGNLSAIIESLRPAGIVGSPGQIARLSRTLRGSEAVPMVALPLPFGQGERRGQVLAYLVKPISQEMLTASLEPLGLAPDMRVLIVDDEPDAVRLLARLLADVVPQCQISTSYSGEDALRRMLERPPDLLVLDIVMPRLPGHKVLERMAADPGLAGVPVIVISARDEPDADRAVEGTVLLHLPQPAPLVRVAGWVNDTLKTMARSRSGLPAPDPTSEEERLA